MTVCVVIGPSAYGQSGADFWAVQVGNSWIYSGAGYTRQDVIAYTDSLTIPGHPTYVVTTSENGTQMLSSWYSVDSTEMREWQETGLVSPYGWLTTRFESGIVLARNPIIVGDHWSTASNGTLSGALTGAFSLSLDVTVLSQEFVNLPSGTYKAYKFQHILSVWANNMYDSVTQYTWFVPYLGIVKRQAETGENENLLSTNVTVPRMFLDVPTTHFAGTFIEQLATAGITGGCAAGPPPQYCPEDSITRGQMAVFLETSLGDPPNECTGLFADVSIGNLFCGFIEKLADDGVTGGCTATHFCPDAPVTRGQMAVFIEAALGNPSNPCTGRFSDVPIGHPFCGFIERLSDDGITGGCGGGNFCPDKPVTRAEMAVFLVAAPPPLSP
jgi:hypothetical protein